MEVIRIEFTLPVHPLCLQKVLRVMIPPLTGMLKIQIQLLGPVTIAFVLNQMKKLMVSLKRFYKNKNQSKTHFCRTFPNDKKIFPILDTPGFLFHQ